MKSLLVVAIAAAALVSFDASARASSISANEVNNGGGGNLQGSVTTDIKINASPSVSIGAMQILLKLTSGQVIDHPFGSNIRPNPAVIPVFPALEFDSYLSAGPGDPIILGASQDLGDSAAAASFTAQKWDASYGPPLGQDNAGAVGYLAARLTLSGDAFGTFRFKVDFSDQTSLGAGFGNFSTIPVQFGQIGTPPEPSTILLVGMAAIALAGRTRTRGLRRKATS